MSFSSGTFSLYTPGNPVVTGTTIASSWANNTLNDIATGLSTCLLKDGSQTVTANIPMASFKFTGLAAGSALTDSATLRQVQYNFGAFLTSVAGTNTITATATPTPAYTVGQLFTFIPAVTNTGAATLNISGVGAGAVQLLGAALTGGELQASLPVTVYVSATTPVFEIVQPTQFTDARALVVGATDATKKIRFEADGITTGTTRVLTMSNENFTTPTTGTTASTFTFDGSGGSTGSLTLTWQKMGNFVTLSIPALSATTGTGSANLISDTALAAAVRPTASENVPVIGIVNNGAVVGPAGAIVVGTDGIITLKRDGASTAFTNTAVAGTGAQITVSYFVG